MQRPGAPERHQTEFLRIVTALDRYRAYGPDHVGNDDAQRSQRRMFYRATQFRRDGSERPARKLRAEFHITPDQTARRQPAQHEIGVGHGGTLTTTSVTGRPRIGPGADRTDLEQVVPVEPGDGATACAHRFDIDHGKPYWKTGHISLIGHIRAVIPDQRNIRTGAAHIERNYILPLRRFGHVGCPHHTGSGPRQGGTNGK